MRMTLSLTNELGAFDGVALFYSVYKNDRNVVRDAIPFEN
jgi:hypothetical protein